MDEAVLTVSIRPQWFPGSGRLDAGKGSTNNDSPEKRLFRDSDSVPVPRQKSGLAAPALQSCMKASKFFASSEDRVWDRKQFLVHRPRRKNFIHINLPSCVSGHSF